MLYYRLYFMDPRTGHIQNFAEFEAPDDEAALALTSEHIGERPLELWCEHRKVRRITAHEEIGKAPSGVPRTSSKKAQSDDDTGLASNSAE